MIDIHAHILPGIDDGAGSLRDAVEMCRLAGVDGIDVIVATPHQRHQQWSNAQPRVLERLRAALQRELGASPRIEIHFVASDMHGVQSPPPGRRGAYERLAVVHGEETTRRLTRDNPKAVLEDRPRPEAPVTGSPSIATRTRAGRV